MERVNTFLTRHLWATYALSVLMGAGLIQLLYPGRSFVAVLARVLVLSLGGLGVALAARRREKQAAGGAEGLVSLDQRLRRGEPPTDPRERQAMRDLVEHRLHRARHRKTALALLAFMFVAITVMTAFTAGTRQTVGFAVLTVVFIGWMIYNSNLQTRRMHTMRSALRSEQAPAEADAAATPPRP
ncbi:hypothetical protein [Streptomyces sp. NPDC006552]|uniref:hypothetical protein n=1 Tax=Streptomyces sp. NPDC006552 TaxID=3157179 RepID=UPI0033AF132D